MKTITDIAETKKQDCKIFGTQYVYLIQYLEDAVIAKPDSRSSILAELEKWDSESRQVLLQDLAAALTADGYDPTLEIT